MTEPPWTLDDVTQPIALEAILTVCTHRNWFPHAIHVRTTHIHTVSTATVPPEKVLSDFKAYATRALSAHSNLNRRRYWIHHGSTRYPWNEQSVNAAVDYVLNAQGPPSALYRLPNKLAPAPRSDSKTPDK